MEEGRTKEKKNRSETKKSLKNYPLVNNSKLFKNRVSLMHPAYQILEKLQEKVEEERIKEKKNRET